MKKYLIKKILSNNVVLVEKNKKNYVLVGKGIGFGKKKGDFLEDPKEIEEKFISLEGLSDFEYEHFLETTDPKIIEICNKIFEMASSELKENLNPKIHAGLIDHVNLAIKRLKEGIEIVNPFLFETKLLYPVEFELAEKAVSILKENLEITIPEAEIGFLALHLYGGRGNNDKEDALKHSKMMNRILGHVGKKLEIDMDKYPFDCQRLIMHLRGVINRVEKNQSLERSFVSKLKDEFSYEFKIAYDISKIMEKALKIRVPESEMGYIALHLHRLNSYKH